MSRSRVRFPSRARRAPRHGRLGAVVPSRRESTRGGVHMGMRRLTASAVVAALLVVVAGTEPVTAEEAAAPAVTSKCPAEARHVNAAHNGRSCTAIGGSPEQLWSVTLNGPTSYPIIADGRVFVTTSKPGQGYGGYL